jgi:hypothetical protein
MSACIFAANLIGKSLGTGLDDSAIEPLPAALAARCGGTLDELIRSLGDLSGTVEEARLFAQIGAAS